MLIIANFGQAYFSVGTLARKLECKLAAARSAIAELEVCGLIHRHAPGGRSTNTLTVIDGPRRKSGGHPAEPSTPKQDLKLEEQAAAEAEQELAAALDAEEAPPADPAPEPLAPPDPPADDPPAPVAPARRGSIGTAGPRKVCPTGAPKLSPAIAEGLAKVLARWGDEPHDDVRDVLAGEGRRYPPIAAEQALSRLLDADASKVECPGKYFRTLLRLAAQHKLAMPRKAGVPRSQLSEILDARDRARQRGDFREAERLDREAFELGQRLQRAG